MNNHEKASQPIEVTLFGIVIFVSDEHPEKAPEPIEVTLFGIVNSLIFLGPLYISNKMAYLKCYMKKVFLKKNY